MTDSVKKYRKVTVAASAIALVTLALTAPPAVADPGPYSPCPGGYRCYVTRTPSHHGDSGSWDFVVQGTDTVASPVDGTVRFVQNGVPDAQTYNRPSLANSVWIDGVDGYCYLLGHFRQGSVVVAPGVVVSHGSPLGQQGNSGYSFGKHVHVNKMSGCYSYRDGNGNLTVWGSTIHPLRFVDIGAPAAGTAPVSGNHRHSGDGQPAYVRYHVAVDRANLRSGPTFAHPVVQTVGRGTPVDIVCFARGSAYGGGTLWAKLTGGQFVHDVLLSTPNFNQPSPPYRWC